MPCLQEAIRLMADMEQRAEQKRDQEILPALRDGIGGDWMTRTPDEIKRELVTCLELVVPRRVQHEAIQHALALIQQLQTQNDIITESFHRLKKVVVEQGQTITQLETQNAELSGKIGQLEAERDAAVNDLHYLVNHPLSAVPCYACLHSKDCWRGGDCDPVNDDRWQWRGICKEGH